MHDRVMPIEMRSINKDMTIFCCLSTKLTGKHLSYRPSLRAHRYTWINPYAWAIVTYVLHCTMCIGANMCHMHTRHISCCNCSAC